MVSPPLGKHPLEDGEERQPPKEQVRTRFHPDGHRKPLPADVLDQLQDAVLRLDLDGNITGCNRAALENYGYSAEELIGQSLALIYPEDKQSLVPDCVVPAVVGSGHYQGELRARAKSGTDVYAYLSVSLIREHTTPVGMLAVLVNIDGRKQLDFERNQNGWQEKAPGSRQRTLGTPARPALERADLIRREIHGTPFLIASPIMHKFMEMLARAARQPDVVLITGETGSGKELVARSIHENSARKGKPWVDINCAALPENLVESELFGYEKGAFSGADSAKPGLFELADKGTLFLDEIGELDLKLQVKLLRVLDGSSYYRLGGHRKITVDVRVVAATNQDLELAIEEGRFRQDLFHRLSQIRLRVPPLRERPADVVALAEHFLALRDCELTFGSDALSALTSYRWPGNVRELRSLVAKLAITATVPEITSADLLAEISFDRQNDNTNQPISATNLENMEEQMIIKALESTGGHRGLAAEQLGISRRTLSRKLREYNITSAESNRGRILGSMGLEQQKCYRAKTEFLVKLKNGQGEEATATAANLSTGGLGLEGFTSPQRFGGVVDASFLLPGSETLIEAKIKVVWTDARGRAGIRFVFLEPALYEKLRHWATQKMTEEGWEVPSS